MRATKYYFDCIIGPFKPFMLKALDKVRQLDVSMICPGHGPVIDENIDRMYNVYEDWCHGCKSQPEKNSHYSLCKRIWLYEALPKKFQEVFRTAAILMSEAMTLWKLTRTRCWRNWALQTVFCRYSHNRRRGLKTNLGSDYLHICRNTRRKAGKRLWKLRMERRGSSSYYRETETASHEGCRWSEDSF